MRFSKLFPRTRRENPKDASSGTKLLVRAGFIEQISRGIWIMTTLGLMVRRRVEAIVRDEMNRAGAIELEVPLLHPRELWDETGRWEKYLSAVIGFHLTDRKGGEFILSPTAEEPITNFARHHLRTHRDLPINLYQIGTKFRDELRPRQGLVRGREFVMKDAYSFDADEAGMQRSFAAMDEAYRRVFERCDFDFVRVEADSGAIGGTGSVEFMALTEFGEDVLLQCPSCGYGGNQEKARAYFPPYPEDALEPLEEIATPDIKTVEQLEEFVGLPAARMAKTIVLVTSEGKPVIVTMRGDLEISETKLANFLVVESVETADLATVESVTGAPVGFAGPINLYGRTDVPYYFDSSVQGLRNFLCGANREDVHFVSVNAGRDFPEVEEYHDLSKAVDGQHCSHCQVGVLKERRGIELGHIFQLQQVYSKPMNATFTAANGDAVPFWMGCYGIGVSRIVQAIVEQRYDDRGILWPFALTPFDMVVIPVKGEHLSPATELYHQLTKEGISVLLDDRDARIGEKLTDAELQGWPIQVLLGRSWDSGRELEVRWRDPANFDTSVFTTGGKLPTATMTIDELTKLIVRLKKGADSA